MNFLTLKDISSKIFLDIVDKSIAHKKKLLNFDKALKNKHIGLLFEQFSTRTIISFQVAIAALGGHPVILPTKNSQLSRGERIKETAMVLKGYLDGLVIRTHNHEKLNEISKIIDFPIINALSEMYHPCQILADIMTIQEEGFDLATTKICFLGDGSSNIAHSLILGAVHTNIQLTISSPKEYRPHEDVIKYSKKYDTQILFCDNIEEATQQADVIYTDVWTSMGNENESAERRKKLKKYQLNKAILDNTKREAIIMHCMPAHFNEEITENVFYSSKSRIVQQAHNKLHTTKALLHYLYS